MKLCRVVPCAITIVAVAGIISYPISGRINKTEQKLERQMQEGANLVNRLYIVVAGENRIQERDEKRKALDNFGFKDFIFDESEPLKFSPTKAGDGINFYMGSGNFDRYVGTIPLNQVEDYLKNTESKKGKK